MRPHGRARVSSRNPQAFAICDRCGFLYNHNRLQWQFDWAGASLINKRILVCDSCNDRPQQQLRAIVVPADPVPIMNPRTQDYVSASTDYRVTQGNSINALTGLPVIGGDTRETLPTAIPVGVLGFLTQENTSLILLELGNGAITLEAYDTTLPSAVYLRVTQQTGEPDQGLNPLPGTDPNAPGNSNPGLPYENVVVPNTGEDQ